MDRDCARYYVESDGRIYLISRNGILDLPCEDEIPFAVERVAPLPADEEIWYCTPQLDEHPGGWPLKDVMQQELATARVRSAVHATMHRVVVEGICLRSGQVLLVRGNRGLTKGFWTLPGGFLRFGESPEEGILREILEEIGVEGRIDRLLGVRSKLGDRSRLHWILLFYQVEIRGEPRANPDEIAEVRFVDLDEAAKVLQDRTMAEALAELVRTATGDRSRSSV
jgi:8-oxo-dGTP diphosphatase